MNEGDRVIDNTFECLVLRNFVNSSVIENVCPCFPSLRFFVVRKDVTCAIEIVSKVRADELSTLT